MMSIQGWRALGGSPDTFAGLRINNHVCAMSTNLFSETRVCWGPLAAVCSYKMRESLRVARPWGYQFPVRWRAEGELRRECKMAIRERSREVYVCELSGETIWAEGVEGVWQGESSVTDMRRVSTLRVPSTNIAKPASVT
jgi:hypothetical protein